MSAPTTKRYRCTHQIDSRNNDRRHIDQQDQADPPEVKLVSEDVVTDGRDDGSLESVVGRARHAEGEDDAEADYPSWKKGQEVEEG